MPTQDGESYLTTIRIKRISHDALASYADENGASYSQAANLFILKGLLVEGLITTDEYRVALRRRAAVKHHKKTDLTPRSPRKRR